MFTFGCFKSSSFNILKLSVLSGAFLLPLLIVAAYFFIDSVVDYGERIERNSLLSQAKLAAASVDPVMVKSLKGEPADADKEDYKYIRSILKRLINTNKELKFVYLMIRKGDQVVFLVDAEPPASPDYSPPGQIYDEASKTLHDSFTDSSAFVEGPLEDRWGVWVSGFAPLVDQESGKVIALIGLDMDAHIWQANILAYKRFAFIFAGLVIVIVILSLTGIFRTALVNRKLIWEVESRKQAEHESQRNERKLMAMSQASHDAIIMIDSDDYIVFWNAAAERLFGYNSDETGEKRLHDLILPEESSFSFWEKLANVKDWENSFFDGYTAEITALHRNGDVFPVHYALSAFEVDNQRFALITVRDVTEQKAVEKAMRESEERSRMLLTSAGEGIFGVDVSGRIIFINPAALDMLGYSEDELKGLKVHAKIHYSYPDGSEYPIEECPMYYSYTKGSVHHERNEVLWRKDGTSFNVSYTSTPIMKEDNLVGAIVTFRDITMQIKGEEALQKRLSELTEARLSMLNMMEDLEDTRKEEEQQKKELQKEISERKKVEEELRIHMEDLERFSDLAVGREERMIQLKEEINELLSQSGKKSKYTIPDKE